MSFSSEKLTEIEQLRAQLAEKEAPSISISSHRNFRGSGSPPKEGANKSLM